MEKSAGKFNTTLAIFSLCIMLRALIGFGPYSGFNDPPMFGDYEA